MIQNRNTNIWSRFVLACLILALQQSCSMPSALAKAGKANNARFSGRASWYGKKFQGKKTASGEKFNMYSYTCAHRNLPFGTKILVENPKNGKTVVVKVNDRGPYAKGRVLDLTRAAAEKLGTLLGGIAYVDCTIIKTIAKK